MKHFNFTPPPPPPHKLTTAACVLALLLLAEPGWAQTTVTSNGREGQTTCMGQVEQNAANLPITALSTSSVSFTVPQVTWSQVVAPLGDGQAPVNAFVYAEVLNARTGVRAGTNSVLAIIDSSSPTYAGGSRTNSSLTANTPYYIHYYTAPAGLEAQTFGRRCFMTGGTYTMNVNPASGQTSGCFSISPRTIEDVHNCWCGRRNTLPLFSDSTENTNFVDSLGCR